LRPEANNLPASALLCPVGPSNGGSMSIFGLADGPVTWKDFTDLTANNPFADSWRQAITAVVLSTFPDRVDVDNSQHYTGE
jgi:hypothetical protein